MYLSSSPHPVNTPVHFYGSQDSDDTMQCARPGYQQQFVSRTETGSIPPSPSYSLSPDGPRGIHYQRPSSFESHKQLYSGTDGHGSQYSIESSGNSHIQPRSLQRQFSHPGTGKPSSQITLRHWEPMEGTAGTKISVRCDLDMDSPPTNHPSTPPPSAGGVTAPSSSKTLRFVLGTLPVHTEVTILGSVPGERGARHRCLAEAVWPEWNMSGSSGESTHMIEVWIQVLLDGQEVLETVLLGNFMYKALKKRTREHLESARLSPLDYHSQPSGSGISSYDSTPRILPLQDEGRPTTPLFYGSDSANSPWQSPYTEVSSLPQGAQSSTSFGRPSVQPSLMRTTQVVGNTSINSKANFVSTGQKATLNVSGDLDSVTKGWSEEEWSTRRRLVQFWRRQEGTAIHAQFRPVTQSEWPQMQASIVISCMFWEKKNSCFITSVDIIYLLEALVGTNFTVEEKNRIRRNLEGFRPITIDKSKSDTRDFFEQIMNLPNPRPRNIEKNVKVYAWDCLDAALQKIIGKYTASFPVGPATVATTTDSTPYLHSSSLPSSHSSFPTPNSIPKPGSPLKHFDSSLPSSSLPPMISSTTGQHSMSAPAVTHSSSSDSLYGGYSHTHRPRPASSSSSSSHAHAPSPLQSRHSDSPGPGPGLYYRPGSSGGRLTQSTSHMGQNNIPERHSGIGLYFENSQNAPQNYARPQYARQPSTDDSPPISMVVTPMAPIFSVPSTPLFAHPGNPYSPLNQGPSSSTLSQGDFRRGAGSGRSVFPRTPSYTTTSPVDVDNKAAGLLPGYLNYLGSDDGTGRPRQ